MKNTYRPKIDKSFLLLFFKKEHFEACFFEKKQQKTFVTLVQSRS